MTSVTFETTEVFAFGVRMLALGPGRIRAVTNYHVTAGDIETALATFRAVLA
jgi:hypothetical protein